MTGYVIKPEPDTRALQQGWIDLLQALACGEKMKTFAEARGRSYAAVKQDAKRAMDALGADTKEQAVAMALRRGLIT